MIIVTCVAAILVVVVVWRWFVTKRKNEQLLLDAQEMNEMHRFEEPLLASLPEPLQPVTVRDMRGQVSDFAMVGRGVCGTPISFCLPWDRSDSFNVRSVTFVAYVCLCLSVCVYMCVSACTCVRVCVCV